MMAKLDPYSSPGALAIHKEVIRMNRSLLADRADFMQRAGELYGDPRWFAFAEELRSLAKRFGWEFDPQADGE